MTIEMLKSFLVPLEHISHDVLTGDIGVFTDSLLIGMALCIMGTAFSMIRRLIS